MPDSSPRRLPLVAAAAAAMPGLVLPPRLLPEIPRRLLPGIDLSRPIVPLLDEFRRMYCLSMASLLLKLVDVAAPVVPAPAVLLPAAPAVPAVVCTRSYNLTRLVITERATRQFVVCSVPDHIHLL
jgi:hypothetical protein